MVNGDLQSIRDSFFIEVAACPRTAVTETLCILNCGKLSLCIEGRSAEFGRRVFPDTLHEARIRRCEWVKGDEDVSECGGWDVVDVIRPDGETCLWLRRFESRVWIGYVIISGPALRVVWHELRLS